MTTATTTTAQTPPADAPTAAATRDRLLGWSGIAFFGLLIPVITIPHASLDNDIDKPPASSVVTAFFREHYSLEQYQTVMHSLAALALLVFGVALAGQVRRVEGPGSRTASRLAAAGAAAAASVMVATMLLVSGAVLLTGGVDGQVQLGLYEMGWGEHPKALLFVAVLLVPAMGILARAGALPRTLTWTGRALAVLCVAATLGGLTAATNFVQYPVFLLLMVWVLATGIVAMTRGVGTKS